MSEKILQKIRIAFVAVLAICAVIVIYKVAVFLWEADIVRGVLWETLDLFGWLLKEVFIFSIPSLILPIIIYLLIQVAADNPIARIISGVGAIYLFWLLSDDLTFSFSGIWNMVRLSIQVYFLLILVIPQELMMTVGAAACMVGSLIIDLFPDLPGSFDDMAAICTMITMVFVYLNTLATIIKRQIGPRVSRWAHGDGHRIPIFGKKTHVNVTDRVEHEQYTPPKPNTLVDHNGDEKGLKDKIFG